ncbi:hypothetical protein XocVXO32_22880, partial [Xanthomonas oryzae pv. oryzicola]
MRTSIWISRHWPSPWLVWRSRPNIARLIQLRAPVEGLVVERFHGQEAVCGATVLQIACLATSA